MGQIIGNLWLHLWCKGCDKEVVCHQEEGGCEGATVWYCPTCDGPLASVAEEAKS